MLTLKSSTCLISLGSIAGPRRSMFGELTIRFERFLHVGGGDVEMRRIPDGFTVTQNYHLRGLVTDTRSVRQLARDVTRRLHFKNVDAVYLLHLVIRSRAN